MIKVPEVWVIAMATTCSLECTSRDCMLRGKLGTIQDTWTGEWSRHADAGDAKEGQPPAESEHHLRPHHR